MRRIAWTLVGIASSLAACSAPADGGPDSNGEGVTQADFSYVGQGVIGTLQSKHAALKGKTWDYGADDSFEAGWILQTPRADYWGQPVSALPIAEECDPSSDGCDPDFKLRTCGSQDDCTAGGTCTPVAATVTAPGQDARSLCVGHSDSFVDEIYNLVITTETYADITSLSPPDGRFEAAVRNAITFLSHKDHALRVRLLYGDIIGGVFIGDGRSTGDVLKSVVRDVDPSSKLRVSVGEYRDGLTSWDHAKMVSVDGKTAIVGGHNMWTEHYLQKDPVHDISLKVHGSAAAHASHFANALWDFTCHRTGFLGYDSVSDFPSNAKGCDEPFALAPARGAGTAKVIAVGRLGQIGDEAADDALVALVDAAKSTLRISQQDLGPPKEVGVSLASWPENLMRALVAAAGRGVEVQLIVSDKNAVPGGLSAGSATYSNGWTPDDVVKKLAEYANAHTDLLRGADVTSTLCAKIHAAALRPSGDDAWPDGATFANHAKLAIADDRAFYIGSQNWYVANLAEFGYIVDDPAATRQLVDAYYTPAWSGSKRTLVSGADAPTCALR